MSYLYPVLAKEVIPGDRFDVSFAYKMELAALFNPVYDGLNVNFEAFYVPNRIVDPRWKTFWTGYNEYNPIEPADLNPLSITASFLRSTEAGNTYTYADAPASFAARTIGVGSLSDFLGVQFASYYENGFPAFPINSSTSSYVLRNLSAYKFLAYHKIVDEFYINTRLETSRLGELFETASFLTGTSRTIDINYFLNGGSGNINFSPITGRVSVDLFSLRQRNYAKDAFTTALPWPELGGDSVRIPVNDNFASSLGAEGTDGPLSAAALGTIAQLKMAFKEYSYAMKDLYKGPRYIENIFAHFGETIREGLVQRPVYLGSVRDYVNFGQVFQTAPSNSTDTEGNELGVGDYSGRGSVEGMHKIFESEFQEPGYVFVLFSISPNARYFQGIDRSNIKRSRKDWFSPEYQDIGEDFIVAHELFNDPFTASGSSSTDVTSVNRVFGWQQRWYDLKWYKDEAHGNFVKFVRDSNGIIQSSQQTSWLFSRAFQSVPVLGETFVKTSPINYPFVSQDLDVDNYNVDMAFDITAYRKIEAVETF